MTAIRVCLYPRLTVGNKLTGPYVSAHCEILSGAIHRSVIYSFASSVCHPVKRK